MKNACCNFLITPVRQSETETLDLCQRSYIFFPGLCFIIFSYFGSFMVVWGFWGRAFQLMGFGACGVGPSRSFGLGLSI